MICVICSCRVIHLSTASVVNKTSKCVRPKEHSICNEINFPRTLFCSQHSRFSIFYSPLPVAAPHISNRKRYPCTSAPLIVSKPQFLDADKKLIRDVGGLKPNRSEHDIFLHLEMVSAQMNSKISSKILSMFAQCNQITSSPLSAAKRLQFNIEVEPVPTFELMAKLPRVIIPLMWVEESCHLNKTYTKPFTVLYR